MPNGPESAQASASGKMKANWSMKKTAAANPMAGLGMALGMVGRAAGATKKVGEYMKPEQKKAAAERIAQIAAKSSAGVGGMAKLSAAAAKTIRAGMTAGQLKRTRGGLNVENRRFVKGTGAPTIFQSAAG